MRCAKWMMVVVMAAAGVGHAATALLYNFDTSFEVDSVDAFTDWSGNGHDAWTNVPLGTGPFFMTDDDPFGQPDNKAIRANAKWRVYSPQNVGTIYDGTTNQWTVEAWLKSASPNSPTNRACILGFGGPGGPDNYVQSIRLGFVKNPAELNTTSATVEFNDGTTVHAIENLDNRFPGERWRHVAATYNGTTLKLFLNAVEVGSATSGEAMLPLTRAALHADDVDQFWGNIDDFRFSDAALDPSQLGYHGALPEPASAFVLLLGACAVVRRRR